jgi:MFS family permease
MSESGERRAAAAAWQHRDFRFYSAARLVGILGAEAQAVGVAWQIYQMTHSGRALGYTGLALFLPGLFFTLPAGHVADLFDRRTVMLACYVVQFGATLWLLDMTLHGVSNVAWIYGALLLIGLGRCFSGPAAAALVPTLVPNEHFVNAVTWGSAIFQIATATGPMFGGILFTVSLAGTRWARWTGAPVVYVFTLACIVVYLGLVGMIRPRGAAEKRGFSLSTMVAGLRYVAHTRLLLGSISLDLFAVLLGGAVSLLPIFADQVLHAGPHGLGLLRAMPSAGALMVSMTLLTHPMKRNAGKKMLVCVAIFGAATVVFGLSRNIWLSCVALLLVGASDMISVVVRSSILQLATPSEMRGRVSSVNWLFLGASNELGEYESGLTAHWWGAVRAVVIGGVASMTITGLWAVFFPALRRADRLDAEHLIAIEKELSATETVR